MATKQIKVTFHSDLSTTEISRKLEEIFWDGEYFEDFEDVDWEITK